MIYNFLKGKSAKFIIDKMSIKMAEYTYSDFEIDYSALLNDGNSYYYNNKKTGEFQRIGIYLPRYNFLHYQQIPALHVADCNFAIALGRKMKATNKPLVSFYSFQNIFYPNRKARICKKCLAIMRRKVKNSVENDKLFYYYILALEDDILTSSKSIDKNGYVINWPQISYAHKQIKNFTCEKCNFTLKDENFLKFIQTHHIKAYDKANNKFNNLMCLCVECHSQVDKYHQERFSSIDNLILLEEFEQYKTRYN